MGHTIERDWVSSGLRCVVLASDAGHRCGYVAVPGGHPLFGVEYGQSAEVLIPAWEAAKEGEIGDRGIISLICHNDDDPPRPDVVFDVHGSLTFSASGDDDYPVPGDGLWWFGFDCAHCDDAKDLSIMSEKYRKAYGRLDMMLDGTVRDTDYVVAQCEKLAKQLAFVAFVESTREGK